MTFWQNGACELSRKLAVSGLDAYVFTDEADIRYLSSIYAPGSLLVLTSDGKLVLFVSPLDRGALSRNGLPDDLVLKNLEKSPSEDVAAFMKRSGLSFVGISDKIKYSSLRKFESDLKDNGIKLSSRASEIDPVIESKRITKSAQEIEAMRHLAKRTRKISSEIEKLLKEGMTDWQIIAQVDKLIRENRCLNAFPTIAAVGIDSANAHAVANGRQLKEDKHLLLDFGLEENGYRSDLTRTICTGRMNPQIRRFYDAVDRTQEFMIKNIKPGKIISELMKEAISFISDLGLSDYVTHGFGHGIGLEVHEAPSLNCKNDEKFKENMVLTVEPGLYEPGTGGVRIEDMVLVTSKGCEVLTR